MDSRVGHFKPGLRKSSHTMAVKADEAGLFNRFKAVAAVATEEGTTNNNNHIKIIIKLVRVECCFLKNEDRAPTLIFFY
ncbi:hypothetical protein SAMN05216332_10754 [Nitrosospira briensis]|nr:hypothetical protein SAMN05216332_10754 [Nitrosospira briensis]